MTWDDLTFWESGEWQVVEEHLKDFTKSGGVYCPGKKNLFAALDATPYEKVKVVLLGQDPYPDSAVATGLAFSIPESETDFPMTLKMLFKEYCDDLHYPMPLSGDLTKWAKQGVLLWNVIPSCAEGKSLSHDWPEWKLLTQEILQHVSSECIVVVACGTVARDYLQSVDTVRSRVIETSHPSPRGSANSKTPFVGSRIFSTINMKLNGLGLDPIDWRL